MTSLGNDDLNFNCSAIPVVPMRNEVERYLALSFFILVFLFDIFCLVIWIKFKHEYDYTRIRSTNLVVIIIFGSVYTSASQQLFDFAGHDMPCWMMNFLLPNCIPFVLGAITSKLVIFYFHAQFSTQVHDLMPTLLLDDEDPNNQVPKFSFTRRDRCQQALERFLDVCDLAILSFLINKPPPKDKIRFVFALKFMLSTIGTWSIVIALGMPFAVVSIILTFSNLEYVYCFGCNLNFNLLVVFGVLAIITTLWNLLIRFRARKFTDPWGFRAEATTCLRFGVLALVCFIVSIFLVGDAKFAFSFLVALFTQGVVVTSTLLQLYWGWRERTRRVRLHYI